MTLGSMINIEGNRTGDREGVAEEDLVEVDHPIFQNKVNLA